MPVVKLRRGEDEWLLQVGDEHSGPDTTITKLNVEEKALLVANGDDKDVMPGNGDPGWEIVSIYPDDDFHELYGVTNVQLGLLPPPEGA